MIPAGRPTASPLASRVRYWPFASPSITGVSAFLIALPGMETGHGQKLVTWDRNRITTSASVRSVVVVDVAMRITVIPNTQRWPNYKSPSIVHKRIHTFWGIRDAPAIDHDQTHFRHLQHAAAVPRWRTINEPWPLSKSSSPGWLSNFNTDGSEKQAVSLLFLAAVRGPTLCTLHQQQVSRLHK